MGSEDLLTKGIQFNIKLFISLTPDTSPVNWHDAQLQKAECGGNYTLGKNESEERIKNIVLLWREHMLIWDLIVLAELKVEKKDATFFTHDLLFGQIASILWRSHSVA